MGAGSGLDANPRYHLHPAVPCGLGGWMRRMQIFGQNLLARGKKFSPSIQSCNHCTSSPLIRMVPC